MSNDFPLRRVRSFVRRDSRITEAQTLAIENNWIKVGLPLQKIPYDFKHIFQRDASRVLEIGFGSGKSLLAAAKKYPEQDFVGIEMHKPSIGSLILGMLAEEIANIRIFYADAMEVLEQCIFPETFDCVQIFFPDPWPKRRHHKRRLIQENFVNLVVSKLKKEGTLHLATDWEDYAHSMMKVLSNTKTLINLAGEKCYSNRSSQRPIITKFEQRGCESGRSIWELQFVKN